jgi:hypothetical protein
MSRRHCSGILNFSRSEGRTPNHCKGEITARWGQITPTGGQITAPGGPSTGKHPTTARGKSCLQQSNHTSRGSIHRQTPDQCKGKIMSTAVKSHLKGVHSQANTQPVQGENHIYSSQITPQGGPFTGKHPTASLWNNPKYPETYHG